MGKLGGGIKGLDKLKGYKDGLTEEDFSVVKDKDTNIQNSNSTIVHESNNAIIQKDSNTELQKHRKTETQNDKFTDIQRPKGANIKTVSSNVPMEFKEKVGLYCAMHDIKETELIYKAVSQVIGYNTESVQLTRYEMPVTGDRVMLYGRFDNEFKTAVKLFEKKNKITEADLVYSAVKSYMEDNR